MRYSIIKFSNGMGSSYYQVEISDGSKKHWMTDPRGSLYQFPNREEAHQFARSYLRDRCESPTPAPDSASAA